MANSKKKVEETRTSIDDLNDSLTAMGAKMQQNQKLILVVTILAAVVIGAILVWAFMVRKPAITRADNAIGDADYELLINGNDSIALELYKDAADRGYDAGNRAKLMAAIQLYQKGDYEEALAYAKKYSAQDDIIGAAAYSLMGDCYVNLDNLNDAVSAFKKAISQSDKNPYYTPFFMLKLARVYRAQDNYADALKLYEEIMKEYPQYAQSTGVNVEKELEYAKIMAAK